MSSVGIITMHRPLNVGCTLQAYATCEAIRQLGHKVEIIDYFYPNKVHHQNGLKRRLLHAANVLAGYLFTGSEFESRKGRFDSFMQEFLPLSKEFHTYQELKENPPEYDIYCAGSDQIWNPAFIIEDDSFLCGFAPKGKKIISYASSFGVSSLTSEQQGFYRQYLARFTSLSTREQKGAQIIEKELGLHTARCLDPTLLLDDTFWRSMAARIKSRIKMPSLVIYGASNPNGETERLARRLARQNGWQIVRIHGRPWQNWTPGFHYMFDVGPLEFLDCITNAKCVLTTTFHGTCFALNFGVPFYSFIEHNSPDTRIANLLTLLGLTDRLFDFGQGDAIANVAPLDNSYKARLVAERQTSLSYLKTALA